MRIGLLAPPWITVPPGTYGGTESVIDTLARALAARGHEVRLFTVATSTCPVPHGWLYDGPTAPLGAGLPEAAHDLAGYEWLAGVDVVHDHTVLGPLLAPTGPAPVVTTWHSPVDAAARRLLAAASRRATLVAVSRNQAGAAPDLPWGAVIHHGVDTVANRPGPGDGGYLVFVGRMSHDKGLHRAIRVARRAGLPLVVASKMWDDAEERYFDDVVRPLLGPDVELHFQLTGSERVELVGAARALLAPISWPEPFGLVMAEAAACGTPVLALRCGAAPEVVCDGVTGFLADDEAGLLAAVARVGELDRARVRAVAVERFSAQRMAADHERLYAALACGAAA